MSKNTVKQPLPLFEFLYRPAQINAELANQLVVYRYPLPRGESVKSYQLHIEQQLAGYRSAFLLRTQAAPKGLFIAVHSEAEIPPQVFSADKNEVLPERVYYADEFAPIWIRLIFRRMSAWDRLCHGYHKAGYPLLVIDSWQSKTMKGLETLRLDCSSFDADTEGVARIVPFYKGISLTGVSAAEAYDPKNEYWEYGENKILHRYIRTPGVQPVKGLYRVYKSKSKRVEPDFLDLSSVEKFKKSRPVILQEIAESFIEHAAVFGFTLQAHVLNLQPWLQRKTKYTDRKKGSTFNSIAYAEKVDVIDLRKGRHVSTESLLSLYHGWLSERNISVQWQLLPDVTAETIGRYKPQSAQRILVLIDQIEGMESDPYQSTQILRKSCAVQHLQVNPNAVGVDPIKSGLLKEYDAEGQQVLLEVPGSDFFDYELEKLQDTKTDSKKVTKGKYRTTMEIKLDVVLKELEIKSLLHDSQAKISAVLKQQAQTLNSDFILIADGYLFTAESDRPVIIPFHIHDAQMRALCDVRLERFDTTVLALIQLLSQKWPHFHQPINFSEVMADAKKLASFQKNLVLLLRRDESGEVSIVLQEYGNVQRYIIPEGLRDTLARIESLEVQSSLQEWFIPAAKIEVISALVAELIVEKELKAKAADDLVLVLVSLIDTWNHQLKILHEQNTHAIGYAALKKIVLASLQEKTQKKPSTTFIKTLDMLFTRYFKRSLRDPRVWLRTVPGLQNMHFDQQQNIFLIGTITPLQNKLARQPSIRQWHAIQGEIDVDWIFSLLDADWVRMNQLPGNPYPMMLIKRWDEIHPGQALLVS